MYEGFFGLQRRPFAATPDPQCCYLPESLADQFQALVRCVELGQGIGVLTAQAGMGKTLLDQVLLGEFEGRFAGVYLGTGQFPTRRALLQTILYELGQSYGGMTDQELRLELYTALRGLISRTDGLLLVLDEAHLLSDRLLEEIRLLADLAQHGVPLVRVVFSGNPEFEERLTSSSLSALNQRIACQISIEPLSSRDSMEYLERRITWAGGIPDSLFERSALDLIVKASDGVPRCLNQLADHSLTQSFLAKSPIVTESTVQKALEGLQHLPLRWNSSLLLKSGYSNRSNDSTRADSTAASGPRTEQTAWTPIRRSSEALEPTAVSSVGSLNDEGEPAAACFEFGADTTNQLESPLANTPPFFESTDDHSENRTVTSDVESFDSECCTEIPESDSALESDEPPLFSWLSNSRSRDEAQDLMPQHVEVSRHKTARFEMSRERSVDSIQSHDTACQHPVSLPLSDFESYVDSEIVEVELVSTATLTGLEWLNRRTRLIRNAPRFRRHRWSRISASHLGRDELVEDKYAEIDRRFGGRRSLIGGWGALHPTASSSATREKPDTVKNDINSVHTDRSDSDVVNKPRIELISDRLASELPVKANGSPVDRIDLICELIELADDSTRTFHGVDLITDRGIEHFESELPADLPIPRENECTSEAKFHLEDWIGTTVVNVGRDFQNSAAKSFPELYQRMPQSPLLQLLDGIERATRFDIVEPETEPSSGEASQNSSIESNRRERTEDSASAPESRYQNLFSLLRRKKLPRS